MVKGPAPRLDLSRKNLDIVKDGDFGVFLDPNNNKSRGPLQSLFLYSNRLTTIPAQLIEKNTFSTLKVLYLNGNNISEVPEAISQLNQLVKLHLEHNQIRTIPSAIRELSVLRKLYLNNNQIETLPDEIGKLTQLQVLHLNDNNIRILSPFIGCLNALKELTLFNNPIQSPPPFTYDNKPLAFLRAYLKEVMNSIVIGLPDDQYVYTRSISFQQNHNQSNPKKKLSAGNRSVSKGSLSTRAHQSLSIKRALNKSKLEREFVEDSLSLNQNHLLYFLTTAGICETQGHREYMEDESIALPRLHQRRAMTLKDDVVNLFSKVGYYGVFDGHGGVKAAEYLVQNLHHRIINRDEFARGDFEAALRLGFAQADAEFLQMCRSQNLMDGSTGAVCLIVDNKLLTAHAGDSRIVLCRDKTAIRLTEDHKPDRADELARIEAVGGEVIFRGNCFRVAGDLAMSRSFGDLRLKEPLAMVTSEPEIRIEELTPKDKFVIIASDGLWDVVSDQRACDLVRKLSTPEEAARRLVEHAMALGTMDNTTVIVIKLDWHLDFLTMDEMDGHVVFSPVQSDGSRLRSQSEVLGNPSGNSSTSGSLGIKPSRSDGVQEIGRSVSFEIPPTPMEETPPNHHHSLLSHSDDSIIVTNHIHHHHHHNDNNDTNNNNNNLNKIVEVVKSPKMRKPKDAVSEEEITEEQLERTRSSSFSFRDSLELINSNSNLMGSPKPLPSESAMRLRVVTPSTEPKLMMFDNQAFVFDVIQALVAKYHLTEPLLHYSLFYLRDERGNTLDTNTTVENATEIEMDPEKQLKNYPLQDNDCIELRTKTEPSFSKFPTVAEAEIQKTSSLVAGT